MQSQPSVVEMYTDGSCRGNPGPGGWGVILRYGAIEKSLSGAEAETTNNRMELMAAIQGLEALKRPCQVVLTTDSKYLQHGMTQWLPNWRRKGWKNSSGQWVKNQDLWQRLDRIAQKHQIIWQWTRGHSLHQDNNRADRLANEAVETFLSRNKP